MKTHKDFPLFVMNENGRQHLDAVLAFAEKVPEKMRNDLYFDLSRLEKWNEDTRCLLYPDFGVFGVKSHSGPDFSFVIYATKNKDPHENIPPGWTRLFNGGLVFHGDHDGFGSGVGFSPVTIVPTAGWALHT